MYVSNFNIIKNSDLLKYTLPTTKNNILQYPYKGCHIEIAVSDKTT